MFYCQRHNLHITEEDNREEMNSLTPNLHKSALEIVTQACASASNKSSCVFLTALIYPSDSLYKMCTIMWQMHCFKVINVVLSGVRCTAHVVCGVNCCVMSRSEILTILFVVEHWSLGWTVRSHPLLPLAPVKHWCSDLIPFSATETDAAGCL